MTEPIVINCNQSRVRVPFFPMRPRTGPDLTKHQVKIVLEQMDDHRYLFQRKLNGDRALLTVHGGTAAVFNRFGGLYGQRVRNAGDFVKLGNHSLLDGEIFNGCFYPFEALIVAGRNFMQNTVEEREIIAFQMSKLAQVEWLFHKPTKSWLSNMGGNMPVYDGLVRKQANLPYVPLGRASSRSPGWLKLKFR